MGIKEKIQRHRGGLLENTVMLYILQFSNMALGLVTQGYQMRVLGVELIGVLGAAQYATNFFQILIDFGFIYSATAKVSRFREDKNVLNKVLTCVILAKALFMALSFLILFVFIAPSLPDMSQVLVYAFYLISVCTYALLPDFMYRGLEQMATITVRAVAIKFFATMMIFLFVRQPGDYYMVPLFTAIGNVGAIVFVYWHLFHKVGVRFCKVTWYEVWVELKESSQFFLSKVAGSINSNLNGILLGTMAGPTATGLYTNADKIIGAARSGMSPIADSLYPHMMKHRNFRLIKKAMLLVYPIILVGCAIVFIFAEPLLVLWLGEGDAYALLGELLRAEYGLGVLPAMARGADGKPYFPGEPELHFNVSHSGGLALCGAGEAPLGVDVEVLRPRRPGLARYVCSEAESAWLERQGGDWGAFYTLWTLKEARVKCTGEGLRRPPRDIAVPLLRPGETGELDGLAFSAFFGETWRAAACCPTPQGPLELFVRNS